MEPLGNPGRFSQSARHVGQIGSLALRSPEDGTLVVIVACVGLLPEIAWLVHHPTVRLWCPHLLSVAVVTPFSEIDLPTLALCVRVRARHRGRSDPGPGRE